MTRLRAVLFDLDNTLLDTAGVERRRWAHVVPLLRTAHPELDEPTLAARYRAFSAGRREVDLGLREHDEFRRDRLAHALEPWGRPIAPLVRQYLALSNALADTIAPVPGHNETLRAARSAGLAVGILTNGPAAWQRRKLELTGIGDAVDAIAISAELGVAKPDPAAFHRACELLGVAQADTAMVGDSEPFDIAGARAAGLAIAISVQSAPLADVPQLLAA
jgi:putative hydrolase of the HAD superfamily